MQKNTIISLIIPLLLPGSLLTMDASTDPEPMTIHGKLVPESSPENSLSCSTLANIISNLSDTEKEKVFDKVYKKDLADSNANKTAAISSISHKSEKPALPPKKTKVMSAAMQQEGMPTLFDAALYPFCSYQTMAIKLLSDKTFSPMNKTHSNTLEQALKSAMLQDNHETILTIANLVHANEYHNYHGSLLSDETAQAVYNYLATKHQTTIALCNKAIEKSYNENCEQFNTATNNFKNTLATTIIAYAKTIQSDCSELDKCVSAQQEVLNSKRQQFLLLKAFSKSIHGNIEIAQKKDLNIPTLNPGLTQFETHRRRLDSIQRNSQIPLLDIPMQNQQLALTDK